MVTLALNAEKIRRLCEDRGIKTDQALAAELGVDKATASRVLNGQAPGPRFIGSVLTVFPAKFEELFEVVDTERRVAPPALAAEKSAAS